MRQRVKIRSLADLHPVYGEVGRKLEAQRISFERALRARRLTPRGAQRVRERWLDGINPPWWTPDDAA
jgi:hypothetical protein